MERGWASFVVKSIDEERREFSGIATTPTLDSVGDVVEPLGVEFKNPLPLLWFHQMDKPVGEAKFTAATKDGIAFTASLPFIAEAGALKDRVDEAWQSVKAKLIRGVSIGFLSIEAEPMKGKGIRYKKSMVYELSLVSVPANVEATIQIIRSIDTESLAASGKLAPAKVGDGSQRLGVVKANQGTTEMDYGKSILHWQGVRATKAARMKAIVDESEAKGETLPADLAEEYETLKGECKGVDEHLARLAEAETLDAKTAKPVDKVMASTPVKDPALHTIVKAAPKLEPGIAFARLARVKALARLDHERPMDIAERLYPLDEQLKTVLKGNIVAANTLAATWAGNLVPEQSGTFADFAEWLRPQTILGKFGAGGVPSLRRVPFRVRLLGQTSGGEGYWVGEGKPKPLTQWTFGSTTLEPLKVANIAVATMELLRDSSPSAEMLIRDELRNALVERLDIDFIDPAKIAVSNVSPASITNGVTGIVSSGTDAAAVREDIKALMSAFIAANNPPTSGVWIMSAITAISLSLMQNPLGQAEFPGIGMNGGSLFGMPAIISEYVAPDSAGHIVILVNASDIYLADEGGVAVDMSDQASLQMLDNPTNDTITPTPTSMVSLWQTNSVGFRAERTINWARRRTSAVAYLTGVNWGTA